MHQCTLKATVSLQMWEVTVTDEDAGVEVLADLTHHLKPVNVVRFAPLADILLASADDGQSAGQLRVSA